MNAADDNPWHVPVNAKLASILASSGVEPAWYRGWMALRPQSSNDERLAVYQAIRDSGCLPAEAGFYLVSWQIDAMTSEDAETKLRPLEDQIQAIRRAHGINEDDSWPPSQAPAEYEALRREYNAAWEDIFVAKLKACGEREIARLYRSNREEFELRSEAGREFFHGPSQPDISDAPDWLHDLAESVAGHITADSAAGPLRFRWREEDGLWELVMYPRPVELVGGANDGAVVDPGFSLDLEGLRGEFEQVIACSWQSLGFPDDGPQVSIEGVYRGHEVFVRVLACARTMKSRA